MMELTMAAFLSHLQPSVSFDISAMSSLTFMLGNYSGLVGRAGRAL